MFTPFMKNTLLAEKRSCSRMSLQRQVFTPFYEEYTLLWEEEVQPGCLYKGKCSPLLWRIHSSLRRGGLAGCHNRGKCSPLWRIHSSLRRGGQMLNPFMKNTLLSEKRSRDKCSPLLWRIHSSLRRGGQMFTPFMKNTLFFEKRRSNVHPFYEEYTVIWEESCSRMSLQRQMFAPLVKNTLFLRRGGAGGCLYKGTCSPLLWRMHSSLRRGGAAGCLWRDKCSPLLWRIHSSLRRGGAAGCLCRCKCSPLEEVKCSPLSWRIH